MRGAFPAAVVALLCFFCCTVPALAGDLEGTVTLKSQVAPRAVGRKKVRGYGVSSYSDGRKGSEEGGPPPGARVNEVEYVVLYLLPAAGNLKATPTTTVMRQKDKDFVPHVLPVVKGSKVVFTNEDLVLHHIYSTSPTRSFEIPKYSKGKSRSETMDRPGLVEVFCGLHPRMNAYILVVENDFFTMADGAGNYSLKNIPPGKYTLKAWHPRVKPVTLAVEIPEKGSVRKDVTL